MTRKYVQESVKLAPKKADGTYPIVIITEGEGSSGVYEGHLFDEGASEHVFENVPSFMDHPVDPAAPHLRSVNSIGGRVSGVHVGEDAGRKALLGEYKPRDEYAKFVEEFADVLGISIFCGADGEVLEDGRLKVSEFDGEDPYRSVDIVVAAGRGGRFKRAEESLRVLESSLGIPASKPAAEASAEEKEGEHMEEVLKAIEALTKSLEPVVSFVNESAAKKADESQTKVDAEALDSARAEGAKAAAEGFQAVDDAKLPETIAEGLKAQVLDGKDVTDAIAQAKAVAEAVVDSAKERGFVINESAAGGSNTTHDWSL
ncbi:hypothetical protein ACI7YT_12755 [Microbacterium sp. M]|uniref:hypothetical protein n=1 Tax=Microbacterium sp. M TaxID=3377125 RepID=UPI00386E7B8E